MKCFHKYISHPKPPLNSQFLRWHIFIQELKLVKMFSMSISFDVSLNVDNAKLYTFEIYFHYARI